MKQAAAPEKLSLRHTWPTPPASPRWFAWIAPAALLWALGYFAVRVWWAISGTPHFGRLGFDLMFFSSWRAVALSASAAILAVVLRIAPWRWLVFAAAWTVFAAHLLACHLLLLDLVGGLLPGMGVEFSGSAFLSRSACLVEGILAGATAVAYRRRWRSDCLFCGRTGVPLQLSRAPKWAWWAAYAAVGGCLIRLGAQVVVGFGWLLRYWSERHAMVQGMVFETGFLLAGVVLPLALVHSWGRIAPKWIPLIGGQRVPRWLPLGPALVISTLMIFYFGFTLVKIAAITFGGEPLENLGPLPLAFFWVAVPGYLIWGIGLGIASISYYRMTYPKCRVCRF